MLLERRAQIFGHGDQPTPIPGYTNLPYVDTDGTNHFDTGIASKVTTVLDAQMLELTTATQALFGKYNAGTSRYLFGCLEDDVFYGWLGNASTYTQIAQADLLRHIFSLDPFARTASVDAISISLSAGTYSQGSRTLGIGGYRNTSLRNLCKLRIYGCKLLNSGGTEIAKFEPKKREADGVCGLYDVIGGTFIEPKNTL